MLKQCLSAATRRARRRQGGGAPQADRDAPLSGQQHEEQPFPPVRGCQQRPAPHRPAQPRRHAQRRHARRRLFPPHRRRERPLARGSRARRCGRGSPEGQWRSAGAVVGAMRLRLARYSSQGAPLYTRRRARPGPGTEPCAEVCVCAQRGDQKRMCGCCALAGLGACPAHQTSAHLLSIFLYPRAARAACPLSEHARPCLPACWRSPLPSVRACAGCGLGASGAGSLTSMSSTLVTLCTLCY